MSNKSGVSSEVISLPKGGGALHGLGEKFSPDLHTGTGNFTVPIALPPGRNGFQPQLNLVYSTGNGNGPFGLGWSLSIPGVSRQTAKGIPRYDDSTDVFVLSGAEDLVPVEPVGKATRYRPRTEGLFARIQHHHDADNNYWEVRSKDGLVSFYGTPQRGGTRPAGRDPAVIADPDNAGHVFAWKLTRTEDPFGNRIEYLHERDAVQTDGPHEWDQLYLSEIRYVDYGDPANPQFLVTVRFIYEGRPDLFSEYRAGFEVRTVKRCVRIEVSTHPDTIVSVRTYHLDFLDQRGLPPEQLPLNAISLLSQIRVEGHDGSNSEWLPPLEFGYTPFDPAHRSYEPFHALGNYVPERSLARADYELVDLFGNGLPDVIQMDGITRYWRNRGNSTFDLPRTMQDAPPGVRLEDVGVQIADMDGDGRADLLVTDGIRGGYYSLTLQGGWDRRSFVPYEHLPTMNLENPDVRLVDLDGNGVVDALRTGVEFELYYNDRRKGWERVELRSRGDLDKFPNVNFGDPRVKLADMTGDGLQDVVLIHNGRIDYWSYLGYGRWGRRITMHNSPQFEDSAFYGGVEYDPKRVLLGDVDGDGCADLAYVASGHVTVWVNQSGNGWSDPIRIHGTPPITDVDAVRLADMHGIGTVGILWTYDYRDQLDSTYKFLDLTGGVKPYLLSHMNNHMGAVTRVEYAPSTRFYLKDEKRPETRWRTSLPFPVQVVARVEVIDDISRGKLTTEYKYRHGYWDGAEREFRGFGLVEQFDTETFEDYNRPGLHEEGIDFVKVDEEEHFSPPTLTKTWFHQGPVGSEFGEWEEIDLSDEFWADDPQVLDRPNPVTDFLNGLERRVRRDAVRTLRGRILRGELYALDGSGRQDRPYTVTEYLHGVTSLPVGQPWPSKPEEWQEKVFFPHTLVERTTQWERGNEPKTQFKFTDDYDEYGQARAQVIIGVPRYRGGPYLATHTITTYAQRNDNRHYMVDRVARTTSYEVNNDGTSTVSELVDALRVGSVQQNLIGQSLNFYDGPAFQGLPFGQLGDYGATVRAELLVLTQDILWDAYKSGSAVLNPSEEPPYLAASGTPVWTADYPQEFRNLLPVLAGHTYQTGGSNSEYEAGYFAASERRQYDFHGPGGSARGLIEIKRDPLMQDTTIVYDAYDLFATKVTDPTSLETKTSHDYRVFQPREVTDPNGNEVHFSFTPLGLLANKSASGKPGGNEGDQQRASLQMQYDFTAFFDRDQPVFVRTIQYVHHDTETDMPQPQRDETIVTIEYSDGFGRLVQTRTQVEDIIFDNPALAHPIFGSSGLPLDQAQNDDAVGLRRAGSDPLNVVVSGAQVYDNKGQVVEKYEPFFSTALEYALPTDAERGEKVAMYYDPRGHVIRTVSPDSSEERVIFGVPGRISAPNLTDPDTFEPTPWETFTYDANDNAGRTHPTDPRVNQDHWNTPSSIVIDALGRTVESVERNGSNSATDWYIALSTYDTRGNLLAVTDALGRPAFRYVYDLANRPLRTESINAGIRRTVLDAAGNEVERRDSKAALILRAYDGLNRPIRLWARDGADESLSLREHIIYGDSPDSSLSSAQGKAANLLGKVYEHYDEAGLLRIAEYDFKGNVLEKARRVIKDDQILSVFASAASNDWQVQAFRVDWQPPIGTTLATLATNLLDSNAYQISLAYDALNRTKVMQYPEDVDRKRKLLRPRYNRAGALEGVEMDGKTYVGHIAYNAKGQRSLIAYGNGVMARYAYDPQTFRLARLRTEAYAKQGQLTYQPSGPTLQDFAYEYDLAGNILNVRDRTPESGVPSSTLGRNALDRKFTYDPLYRLLSATGRDCDVPLSTGLWDGGPRCVDLTRTTDYTEQYQYDSVGNMTGLKHRANGGDFTREFALVPGSDRLAKTIVGTDTYDCNYDASGNLIQEASSRHFEWDHSDRMRVYRTQKVGAQPSTHAHYFYDASGQRVVKFIRRQGGNYEVTVYVDGIFEHHRWDQNSSRRKQNNRLHIMDNQSRIALRRIGDRRTGDARPTIQYHLGDHLGSSNAVVNAAGALINREEYTPYGETSFGSFSRKRYRFTGKERDEESGLCYHGARYYAPWLARWASCDPAGMGDSITPYAFTQDNPVRLVDSTGRQAADVTNITFEPEVITVNVAATFTEPEVTTGTASPAPETQVEVIPPSAPLPLSISIEGTSPADLPYGTDKFLDTGFDRTWRAMNTPLGVEAGRQATQDYTNRVIQGREEGGWSGAFKVGTGWIGGFFASLWTPETAADTLGVLVFAAGQSRSGRGSTSPQRGAAGTTAAQRAAVDAFAARAKAVGWIENPFRTGSWGKIVGGKFRELGRIDVGEPGMPGWRGKTHIHITGQKGHLDPTTKLPGE